MVKAKYLALGLGAALIAGTAAYAQGRYSDEPAFELITQQGAFEVREYEPMIVAEVTHTGDRMRAMNAGFRRLAAYIFAQEDGRAPIGMTTPVIRKQAEKIAMTSPVTIGEGEDTGSWNTRFVMPDSFTMETLPEPPSDITLIEIPARKMASVKFDGWGRQEDLEKMEGFLRRWMEEQGLEAAGTPEYAFYDAPRVPARMRRNEVMIPVK
ncbi:heme-binding protein [Qipengyuania sp. 1XM1-15A]|uniref:SOUL family heme-binding protein n=1 Tax=Qipengyuania xiamenensis TaxID=2867237 RepID=UPI001C878ECB|nr:heme-binding protein [Qipengyuania xiamenensis]MBX7533335.1 heme-binding protein [Qipengyuania xiamenensis]